MRLPDAGPGRSPLAGARACPDRPPSATTRSRRSGEPVVRSSTRPKDRSPRASDGVSRCGTVCRPTGRRHGTGHSTDADDRPRRPPFRGTPRSAPTSARPHRAATGRWIPRSSARPPARPRGRGPCGPSWRARGGAGSRGSPVFLSIRAALVRRARSVGPRLQSEPEMGGVDDRRASYPGVDGVPRRLGDPGPRPALRLVLRVARAIRRFVQRKDVGDLRPEEIKADQLAVERHVAGREVVPSSGEFQPRVDRPNMQEHRARLADEAPPVRGGWPRPRGGKSATGPGGPPDHPQAASRMPAAAVPTRQRATWLLRAWRVRATRRPIHRDPSSASPPSRGAWSRSDTPSSRTICARRGPSTSTPRLPFARAPRWASRVRHSATAASSAETDGDGTFRGPVRPWKRAKEVGPFDLIEHRSHPGGDGEVIALLAVRRRHPEITAIVSASPTRADRRRASGRCGPPLAGDFSRCAKRVGLTSERIGGEPGAIRLAIREVRPVGDALGQRARPLVRGVAVDNVRAAARDRLFPIAGILLGSVRLRLRHCDAITDHAVEHGRALSRGAFDHATASNGANGSTTIGTRREARTSPMSPRGSAIPHVPTCCARR